MIFSFKHKGLNKLFETGNASGIIPEHSDKLRLILAMLETAEKADDMALPGLKFRAIKKNNTDYWSVKVTGNWLVTFRVKNEAICDVDYEHTG